MPFLFNTTLHHKIDWAKRKSIYSSEMDGSNKSWIPGGSELIHLLFVKPHLSVTVVQNIKHSTTASINGIKTGLKKTLSGFTGTAGPCRELLVPHCLLL